MKYSVRLRESILVPKTLNLQSNVLNCKLNKACSYLCSCVWKSTFFFYTLNSVKKNHTIPIFDFWLKPTSYDCTRRQSKQRILRFSIFTCFSKFWIWFLFVDILNNCVIWPMCQYILSIQSIGSVGWILWTILYNFVLFCFCLFNESLWFIKNK